MSSGKIAAIPTPSIHARTRSGMRIPLRPAQKCDSPDRQPLSYKNVAIVKKDSVMRRDELSSRKLRTRLAPSRSHIAVLCFAVAQLHNHVVFSIKNAHLTIQIGADHPLALSMEVAGHTKPGLVFDRFQMIALEGESLNSAVSAIGHYQKRSFATRIDPLSMRIVEFA